MTSSVGPRGEKAGDGGLMLASLRKAMLSSVFKSPNETCVVVVSLNAAPTANESVSASAKGTSTLASGSDVNTESLSGCCEPSALARPGEKLKVTLQMALSIG